MFSKNFIVLSMTCFFGHAACISTRDRRQDPRAPGNNDQALIPSDKDQQGKIPPTSGEKNMPPGGQTTPPFDLPPGAKIEPTGPVYGGMATHFEALGTPTGGCGVPTELLDTPDFVALNVQHTPGDYGSHFLRPITDKPPEVVGAWENGRNCGRWVMVTLGDRCKGLNDGQPGQGFCRGGGDNPWVSDRFNGASLPMVIADSCQDGNSWCRDDRYHLDLATSSLGRFKKNASPVGSLLPDHWGNRKVSWQYIKAPLYSGDIKLHFVLNSSQYWSAVMVTHLENGIHGIKVRVGEGWRDGTMVGDNGQVFVLPSEAKRPYQIRVLDALDQWVGGGQGRVYQFDFPTSCQPRCQTVYTPVTYEIISSDIR